MAPWLGITALDILMPNKGLGRMGVLRSESPSGMCARFHTVAASKNREIIRRDHSIIACSHHIYIWVYSSCTSRSWWIAYSTQRQPRGCNNIPSFSQRTAPIARSLCEGWTRHDLHILVTALFCCDRKVQSFTLWQQLTIEITRRDHSIITCSCQTYVGVILRAHPVRGESHIQRKANREVATSPSLTWLRHDKYGKNWFKICWRRILAVFAWKNYKIQEE